MIKGMLRFLLSIFILTWASGILRGQIQIFINGEHIDDQASAIEKVASATYSIMFYFPAPSSGTGGELGGGLGGLGDDLDTPQRAPSLMQTTLYKNYVPVQTIVTVGAGNLIVLECPVSGGSDSYQIICKVGKTVTASRIFQIQYFFPIPENLIEANRTAYSIMLSWTNPLPWLSFPLLIERAEGQSDQYERVSQNNENGDSFLDKGLKANTLYEYRVAYGSSENHSDYIYIAITTLPPPILPPIPDELRGIAIGKNGARITWNLSPGNGVSYELERKQKDGSFVKIADLASGESSFTDSGLEPGSTYVYRIRAKARGGYSTYSEEITLTTEQVKLPAGVDMALRLNDGEYLGINMATWNVTPLTL